ncbi:MAG: ThiF family adenylyltransferase [Acidobacteriota bacterium]|nr:ThiF family adenylyltransferase [Acidobacteriota bacterium]
MSKPVHLRIPFGLGARLLDIVHRKGKHEYVAFGLVSHARLGTTDVLLLRDLLELQENDYFPSPGHGAAWRGIATVPIINRAVDEQLGIILFHAHPGTGPPALSNDDEQNADRLVPTFQQRIPARPHGSVVLSSTLAGGLVNMPHERTARRDLRLRWYGTSILDWPPTRATRRASEDTYARQEVLVGTAGQDALRAATIAVVGLGGGGSHVVQQLAHLGIGHLILVDDDHAESTNRHRVIGMTRADAKLRRPKVRVMRRLVRQIGMGTRTSLVPERLPAQAVIDAIKQADIIMGCVDNLDAKADLQQIAHRYLIPYIDIGLGIRPIAPETPGDQRVIIGGNVITYLPGDFCLWCSNHLTPEKVELDRGGPKGYVHGRPAQAQVVSLNGLLASQAVNEALQLLTGFDGTNIRPASRAANPATGGHRGFKKLNGNQGTLEEWGGQRRAECSHCKQDEARGEATWR